MPRKSIKDMAERLADAYSTDRYRNGWAPTVRLLRRRGYDDKAIEAMIRSKWTRWAADDAGMRYGRMTALAFGRWLTKAEITWGRDLFSHRLQWLIRNT